MTTAPPPPKRARPAPPPKAKGKAAVAARTAAEEEADDGAAAATSDDGSTSSDDGSGGDDSSSSGGPTVSSSSDDDEDASASSGDDEGKEGGEVEKITVDFEFHDPAPIDYLGVRTLLLSLLDGGVFDVSGLASAVVAQTRVGTVVKTEAGGDPIALITVFNTDRTPRGGGSGGSGGGGAGGRGGAGKEEAAPPPTPPPAFPPVPALAQLRDYLAGSAPTPRARAALLSAWAGPATGLVLAERLANVPPQVAPPLHQALALETGWATTDEPSPAGRASFALDRLVLVSRAYVEVGGGGSGGDKAGGSGGGSAASTAGGGGELVVDGAPAAASPHPLVWARPEDEHYVAHSTWAWWFRVPARAARPSDGLAPVRVVACVPAPDGWAAARAALDAAIGNPAAGDDGEG